MIKLGFSALAFKVANDPFVGSLTFIRIYSGTIKTGTAVYNTSKDKEERVGRMLLMHANSREDIKGSKCWRHSCSSWTEIYNYWTHFM